MDLLTIDYVLMHEIEEYLGCCNKPSLADRNRYAL